MQSNNKISNKIPCVIDSDSIIQAEVNLEYNLNDPLAITMLFGEVIRWTFARELLANVAYDKQAESGIGDVRVWESSAEGVQIINIQLTSPDGSAVVKTTRYDIKCFLDRTYKAVPNGKEKLDQVSDDKLDQALKDWLL